MKTVRMQKGDLFADINADPECIKNAQKEGWSLVDTSESETITDGNARYRRRKRKQLPTVTQGIEDESGNIIGGLDSDDLDEDNDE